MTIRRPEAPQLLARCCRMGLCGKTRRHMRAVVVVMGFGFAVAAAAAPPARAPAKAPAKATTAPARLYDFKGVALEISLDDFRRMPHPDGIENSRVLCSGEKVAITSTYSSEPTDVMLFDEVEKSLGVKRCIWVSTVAESYRRAGDTRSLSLAGSGYGTIEYSFGFVPDPKDGVLRLYQFYGTSNRNAASDVIEALTTKWGPPKIVNDKVQNRMGASFDQVTALWTNPAASITVQDRWTKIDNMAILVTSNRLSDVIKRAKDAKKAATQNPI